MPDKQMYHQKYNLSWLYMKSTEMGGGGSRYTADKHYRFSGEKRGRRGSKNSENVICGSPLTRLHCCYELPSFTGSRCVASSLVINSISSIEWTSGRGMTLPPSIWPMCNWKCLSWNCIHLQLPGFPQCT